MDRPYVICHILSALDGKIAGDFMRAPETGIIRKEYESIRGYYQCEATLYGTTTMAESFACGFAPKLSEASSCYLKEDYIAKTDVQNYIVSIDTQGVLGWESNYIAKKGRAKAHVIEVLIEKVSDAYLSYLRSLDISYIFAGDEHLDCLLALQKLKRLFGIEKLMIAGGGYINWSFLHENLIDELSLVLAPLADGDTATVTVFERSDFLPARPPAAFTLKEVKTLDGDGVWLRYMLK